MIKSLRLRILIFDLCSPRTTILHAKQIARHYEQFTVFSCRLILTHASVVKVSRSDWVSWVRFQHCAETLCSPFTIFVALSPSVH